MDLPLCGHFDCYTLLLLQITFECIAAYLGCPLPVPPSLGSHQSFQSKRITPLFTHVSHFTGVPVGQSHLPCTMSLNSPDATGKSVIRIPILQMRTLSNRESQWLAHSSTAKNGSRDLKFVQSRSQARPMSLWAKSMSSWSCNSLGQLGQLGQVPWWKSILWLQETVWQSRHGRRKIRMWGSTGHRGSTRERVTISILKWTDRIRDGFGLVLLILCSTNSLIRL